MKPDPDRQLVEVLRCGDSTAAELLVAAYGDRAYRLAKGITGNARDAEEAVQDAFWTVVQRIETFQGDSAFRSWLYGIVTKAAYETLGRRHDTRTDRLLDDVLSDERGVDWSAAVDDPALQPHVKTVLTAAMNDLPVDHRTVLVLRDVEGLPDDDIGEVVGLSVDDVKSRVHRARLFVRRRLGKYLSRARVAGWSRVNGLAAPAS